MKNTNLSAIDFVQFQKKIAPLNDENLSLLKLNDDLRDCDISNLTEQEKELVELFRKISSIILTDDVSSPFAPLLKTASGARTCMPEDITDNEMDFFIGILESVVNMMLKARIADILWFRKYHKNIDYPKIVINIYLSISFDVSSFFENLLFWRRGLYLARQISDNDSLKNFEQRAFYYLDNTEFDGTSRVLKLVELLRFFKLCAENKDQIIEKVSMCGERLEKENSYFLAEQYYNEASLWACKSQNNPNQYTEFQIKRVNAYISYAKKSESGLSSVAHYESALKILRTLDRKKREQYFSKEQEDDLKQKIKMGGKFALTEMHGLSYSLDISESIRYVTDNIKGKDKCTALRNLALLFDYFSFNKLETDAIAFIKSSPLLAMMGQTIYGGDGRVISKTPGIDNFNELNAKNPAVRNNMVWQYTLHISVVVQSAILPALQIIRCEHNIQLTDIIDIVQKSNLIPFDRIAAFAKGVYAGFSFDFMTSLHLLVPQIENMVRVQLQEAGIQTSVIENNTDIEQEVGLSTLVDKDGFETIFGKDLGFEIKVLFCDASGPNLRNNVAHGLLSTNQMNDIYSIYCWWFCFKLVYLNFYNSELIKDKAKGI